jgi:hypothetical protein
VRQPIRREREDDSVLFAHQKVAGVASPFLSETPIA